MDVKSDVSRAKSLVTLIILPIVGSDTLDATADAIQDIVRVITTEENLHRLQDFIISANAGTQ